VLGILSSILAMGLIVINFQVYLWTVHPKDQFQSYLLRRIFFFGDLFLEIKGKDRVFNFQLVKLSDLLALSICFLVNYAWFGHSLYAQRHFLIFLVPSL
jgi:hypothetical protein